VLVTRVKREQCTWAGPSRFKS